MSSTKNEIWGALGIIGSLLWFVAVITGIYIVQYIREQRKQ